MTKEINIALDEHEHARLKRKKGKLTWKEFLLSKDHARAGPQGTFPFEQDYQRILVERWLPATTAVSRNVGTVQLPDGRNAKVILTVTTE